MDEETRNWLLILAFFLRTTDVEVLKAPEWYWRSFSAEPESGSTVKGEPHG